jgi:hypothetical protein
VRVEDVTEDEPAPLLLAEDTHPYLSGSHWHFESPSKNSSDPDIAWVLNIEDSSRVYRFTILLADGQRIELYQMTNFSAQEKTMIRRTLGQTY